MPVINAHADIFSKARGLNFGQVFIYIHTSHIQAEKAVAHLHICANSHELLLLPKSIITKILCTAHRMLHKH